MENQLARYREPCGLLCRTDWSSKESRWANYGKPTGLSWGTDWPIYGQPTGSLWRTDWPIAENRPTNYGQPTGPLWRTYLPTIDINLAYGREITV